MDETQTGRAAAKPIATRKKPLVEEEQSVMPQIGKLLMGFAILCFVTSFVMNSSSGDVVDQTLDSETLIGPVTNKKANTVYFVKVNQNLGNGASNYISIDVLNSKKEYLFAFGKELWWEEGYDSDGRWTEGTKNVEMKITIKDIGDHYFRISPDSKVGSMRVTIEQKRASSLPHTILGIISIVLAIGILVYYYRERIVDLMDED